jgi:short-subunit dehydrogenase
MFRNIIITGASNGLGMSIARRYAAPGVCLGLIGRHNDRLNEVSDWCRKTGTVVESVSMDVRDRDNLIKWIEMFDSRHPVDLVIANAGVMFTGKKGHPTEEKAVIDELFDVNFHGVIDTVNPLLVRMAGRGRGSAAIISSLSAYHGIPTFPAYSASKVAVKAYFEAIRGVYARQGVYISIICPSYVDTDMTGTLKINRFMLMDRERAVDKILHGIERHKALISFPWYHALGIRLLGLLPERLADRILLLALGK